jgi:hypothetical protein
LIEMTGGFSPAMKRRQRRPIDGRTASPLPRATGGLSAGFAE